MAATQTPTTLTRDELEEHCRTTLARHAVYVQEHLEDLPEVRDWTWSP